MADPIKRSWQPTDKGTHRRAGPPTATGLIAHDGRPIAAPPQLLVPDSAPSQREEGLTLNATPNGVMLIIKNGDTALSDGDQLTATTVPWAAMPDVIDRLVRMLALHFPRPLDDDADPPAP